MPLDILGNGSLWALNWSRENAPKKSQLLLLQQNLLPLELPGFDSIQPPNGADHDLEHTTMANERNWDIYSQYSRLTAST